MADFPQTNVVPNADPAVGGVAPKATETGDKAVKKEAQDRAKAAAKDLNKKGQAEYRQMSDDDKKNVSTASGKLCFISILGNPFQLGKRRVGKDTNGNPIDETCSTPVGFLFKAVEDVSVPRIDCRKTTKTGFSNEDITWETVKAGSNVLFTYLELFVLGSQIEYSFRFGAEVADAQGNKTIDPKGFRLDVKLTTIFAEGDKKKPVLPSPSPALADGQIKAGIVDICDKTADGKPDWSKKDPSWEQKFAPIFERSQRAKLARVGGEPESIDKSAVMALICRGLIKDMLDRGTAAPTE